MDEGKEDSRSEGNEEEKREWRRWIGRGKRGGGGGEEEEEEEEEGTGETEEEEDR